MKELFVRALQQTAQNRFEASQTYGQKEYVLYLNGKIDAYREILYTMGMSHDEIDFAQNLQPKE